MSESDTEPPALDFKNSTVADKYIWILGGNVVVYFFSSTMLNYFIGLLTHFYDYLIVYVGICNIVFFKMQPEYKEDIRKRLQILVELAFK